jgi:hypothetical protein
MPRVARHTGEGSSLAEPEPKNRRSWPLPDHATILDCQLTGTGRSLLCSALHGRRVKNACYKHTFQVFHRYVTNVSDGCCKSRSGYYICCNSYTRMLQASILMFHLCFLMYVANVFIWMLHMFHTYVASVYIDVAYACNGFQVFFRCFFASVPKACLKCFICLQTYV